MTCMNKKIGKLLFLYEFDKLSSKEKELFEAHLLDCDYCFQQLHDLAPVVTKMRDNPYAFYPALTTQAKPPRDKRLLSFLKSFFRPLVWASPFVKPAFAVALLVFVVLIGIQFWPDSPQNYADLARIEPLRYIPLNIKGPADMAAPEKLFAEGMQFYSLGRYEQAITRLDSSRRLNPEDTEAAFYLGLSCLLADRVDIAIEYFQFVIDSGEKIHMEKSRWFLANAYLRKEDAKRALVELEKVIQLNGAYKWQAEEMIQNILAQKK